MRPWEICPKCGKPAHLAIDVDRDAVRASGFHTWRSGSWGKYVYYRVRFRFGHYKRGNNKGWHSIGRISSPEKRGMDFIIFDLATRYSLTARENLGQDWLNERGWKGEGFEDLWYESQEIKDKVSNAFERRFRIESMT